MSETDPPGKKAGSGRKRWKAASLRWIFLLAALFFFVGSVFGGARVIFVAGFAACGLAWWLLSKRKAESLDGNRLGIRRQGPERRNG